MVSCCVLIWFLLLIMYIVNELFDWCMVVCWGISKLFFLLVIMCFFINKFGINKFFGLGSLVCNVIEFVFLFMVILENLIELICVYFLFVFLLRVILIGSVFCFWICLCSVNIVCLDFCILIYMGFSWVMVVSCWVWFVVIRVFLVINEWLIWLLMGVYIWVYFILIFVRLIDVFVMLMVVCVCFFCVMILLNFCWLMVFCWMRLLYWCVLVFKVFRLVCVFLILVMVLFSWVWYCILLIW